MSLTDTKLLEILSINSEAIVIYEGEDLKIRFISQTMLYYWDKDRSIVGTSLNHVFAENTNYWFIDKVKEVWQSGENFKTTNIPAEVKVADNFSIGYFDIEFQAFFTDKGKVCAVLQRCTPVQQKEKVQLENDEKVEKKLLQELLRTKSEFYHLTESDSNSINNLLSENYKEIQFNEVNKSTVSKIIIREEQFNLALKAAKFGVWTLYFDKNKVVWDDITQNMLGFENINTLSLEEAMQGILPSDRGKITNEIAKAKLPGSDGTYELLFRTNRKNGKGVQWINNKGKVYFDQHGEPLWLIGVSSDVTERIEEEQRKLDFISIASHELKTPLTTILTFLQLLSQRYELFDDFKKMNMIQQAWDQGQRMKNLIDGFLNVSKLQNGQLTLDKSKFRMNDLLEKVKGMYKVLTPSNSISFTISYDCKVHADQHKIEGVILNFINNAIKYAPQNSPIDVEIFKEEAHCGVRVIDQGPGIPRDDQSHIFDKFYRVLGKENEVVQGFGIGLYISAEIIKQHGGKIGLHSDYGHGATFWFLLPVFNDDNLLKN